MLPEQPVQLARGTVRHVRLRPLRHAFGYPVHFLRVRVDVLGSINLPWMLSYNRFNLFSIRDDDYGYAGMPLGQGARHCLEAAGIHDADGAIWLHTFPRIFGYAFNPVSFWHCERDDGSTRAIVCEVNNTFGERHSYVIANQDGTALQNGQLHQAPKRMHVSPFSEVRGQYQFRFHASGAGAQRRSLARIDYADEGGEILRTSISGTWQPATAPALLRALLNAPLQSIAVMARIHWQALRLWVKRVPWFRYSKQHTTADPTPHTTANAPAREHVAMSSTLATTVAP
jgi:DUF1365 family protein